MGMNFEIWPILKICHTFEILIMANFEIFSVFAAFRILILAFLETAFELVLNFKYLCCF